MTSLSNPEPDAAANASFCAACGVRLSVGARYCHRCGTPAGEGRPLPSATSRPTVWLPWGITAVALLMLVANIAGKTFAATRNANRQPSEIGAADDNAPLARPTPLGVAPNLAGMSPSERANRLYLRMARYAEAGTTDSIQFFAPMAMAAHEMLANPSLDERFHYGRIAEFIGNPDVARAQAEAILADRPTSLLGLLLAARIARLTSDDAAARAFDQRLLAALSTELASNRSDYDQHRLEIDREVAEARKRN